MRYEITYFTKDEEKGLRRNEYHTNDKTAAISQAKILKNDLGYFPVVVYDNVNQDWIKYQ